MNSDPIVSRLTSLNLLVRAFVFTGCLLILSVSVRGGFLYVLNQQNGAPNLVHGFSVNESTGALTPLAGFPVSSGGNGTDVAHNHRMTIDRANQRLYVVNAGSNTVSAFSINAATGALTPLPYSPIALPAGLWATVSVHPSGSPLVVGDNDATPVIASFNITATSATAAAGGPFSTGTARPNSSVFSRDGFFLYAGGGGTNPVAAFAVNSANGVLSALPATPVDSGAISPNALATDWRGRLFMTSPFNSALRAFTTDAGVPAAVTGNPFTSGLALALHGVLSPNERFYYAADQSTSRVGGFQITGSGAATALAPVTGSPFNSSGTQTNMIALNNNGAFLYAANAGSRNISTYSANTSTGVLTFGSVQTVNTLGTTGTLTGIAYQPTVFTVTNTNDSGVGSLRQAVTEANAAGGGIIVFDPAFFNVPRTISLTTGQMTVSAGTTIKGTGAGLLTLRVNAAANAANRAFNISSLVPVTISGITMTGGNVLNPGGALFVSGVLALSDCVLTGNTAAGVGGAMRIQGANALVTVINSTVYANNSSAPFDGGGGIDNASTLNIINSTISGNTKTNSTNNAGGVFNSGTLTVTNSTITDNSSPNGAGGIFNASAALPKIRNSIVAGNRNNGSVADVGGAFDSDGFNLVGNLGTATGFTETGDQTGTGGAPLDPGLVKVLALNGGGVPTHALLSNSPAVDKGLNANFATDQRGFARPFDNPSLPNTANGADIGAFERRAAEPNLTAPFDFDGDNKTDIGIFRASDGSWWYIRSSDAAFRVFAFGVDSDLLAPGDFTGDGKTDITVFRPSSGNWFIQRSEDNSFFSFPFGLNGDIPAPADYDGDGKADAAVFRPGSGTWFILNSNGSGTSIVPFGTAEDKPVVADYDGDGKADIAVFRPSDGSWWYLRSSDAQFRVFRFGVGTDKPVQGDWTGDGKADIAVFRPSNGTWFVQRSEDNSFFSFPFGANGDVPAPGDYDGDGRTDAAIFRPSEGNWYINRSTAGILIAPFGSNGDRPVANAFVP